MLPHEKANQTIDVPHFLLGIDATASEAVTHAGAGANAFWHTVDTAELRRQVDHALTVLNDEKRLPMVCNVFAIGYLHVPAHTNFLIIVQESFVRGVRVEVDVAYLVGTHVTPVSNDARADNLLLNELLELPVISGVFLELLDFVEARNCRHESKERVNGYSDTSFAHENRGFVALKHLKPHSR